MVYDKPAEYKSDGISEKCERNGGEECGIKV